MRSPNNDFIQKAAKNWYCFNLSNAVDFSHLVNVKTFQKKKTWRLHDTVKTFNCWRSGFYKKKKTLLLEAFSCRWKHSGFGKELEGHWQKHISWFSGWLSSLGHRTLACVQVLCAPKNGNPHHFMNCSLPCMEVTDLLSPECIEDSCLMVAIVIFPAWFLSVR